MDIRDARADDATACAAIYAPYVTDTVVSFESVPPGADELAVRIAAAQRHHAWLVAETDGSISGYAYAGQWRSRAAYARSCEVSVYVAADRAGHGVGRALYAALLPRLADLGFHTALAGMVVPNPASVALHRSFGFTEVGTFREVGHKAGGRHDVLWMQLMLSGGGSRSAPR